MNKLVATILLLSIVFLPAVAQRQKIYFETLTKDDGLSSNKVPDIIEDKSGFMWFATKDGLNKFDGYNFEIFKHDPDDSTSIPSNIITCIEEEKSTGNLFIGSSKLCYFDVSLNKCVDFFPEHPIKDSLVKANAKALYYDRQGNLWIGTYKKNDNIYRFDKDKSYHIFKHDPNNKNTIPRGQTQSFHGDNDGNVWIGKQEGFAHYSYNTNSFTQHPDVNLLKRIQAIKKDNKGNLWLGSPIEGLILIKNADFNEKLQIFSKETGHLINNYVQDMVFDDKGNLYIANRDAGLVVFNTQTKTSQFYTPDIHDPKSLSTKAIITICRTKSGMIWIGSFNSGINYIDNKRKPFEHYKINFKENGLFNNNIRSLFEDSKGYIWVGTKEGGGLSRFNPSEGTFINYKYDPKDPGALQDEYVFAINEIDVNHIVVGTLRKGFGILDKRTGKFKHLYNKTKEDHLVPDNFIYKIFKDKSGDFWIGTINRTAIYDSKFQNFHLIEDISVAKCFLESDDDKMWIGTSYRGLYLFDKKNKKILKQFRNEKDQLFIRQITALAYDKNGVLWVSTDGEGFYKYNKKDDSFTQFSVKDGLPNEIISCLLVDENDNIWCATGGGLSKFNPEKKTFRNYDVNDGLQGNEFETYVGLKTSSGQLLFGGKNGLNIFKPDSIVDNMLKPKVVLTNLKLFNKNVPIGEKNSPLTKRITYTDEITLDYWQSVVTFSFSALNFSSPEKNQYAYMMQNFEEEWNYVGSQKNATYTNLPAGEYIFRVKASNNDGYWNEDGVSLKVTVLPPWWETWWFRAILIVVTISSILSFYFYRVNALKRQKRILEQKVTERTTELREANSQLEEKQEEILQQNEEIIAVNNQLKTKNEEIESQKEEIEASRDQLEKAFNNITLLSEFGQKLTATFDFDAINKMIYEYVSSLMDTAAFGIGIYNEKRKIIDFPYFMEKGNPVPYFFKDITSEKSLSVRCFKNSEEIFINDLSVDYKKYLGELPEVQTTQLPASVIHLPLTIENKPIGTLTVNSFKKNAFNENDVANLRTLASYISIALDNSKAYRIIRSKNEQISGSIRYGQTIQQAMLPGNKQLNAIFENFIIFRPKDIVSGDFYWFASIKNPLNPEGLVGDKLGNPQGLKKDLYFLAVVDCTGHGVPGAFMSMIGSRLLSDIVIERKIYSPAKILEQLNTMIRKALRQDTTDNHDGMDLCLCRFQQIENEWELTYAGAKRPLIFYSSESNQIEEIQGTRQSIGGVGGRRKVIEYTEESRNVNTGDVFYLSTDGLVDQCNPKKRKFSHKKLVDLFNKIYHLPLSEQKKLAENELDTFQEGFEQRDDITLVGVKLKS